MKKKKIIIILIVILILLAVGVFMMVKNRNLTITDILEKYDYELLNVQNVGDNYTLAIGADPLPVIYKNMTYAKDATRIVITYKNSNDEIKKALDDYYKYYSSFNDISYVKKDNYYYINGHLDTYGQYVYILGYDTIEIHCLSNDDNKKELDKIFRKLIK